MPFASSKTHYHHLALFFSQLLQNKHNITPLNVMEVFKTNTNAIELKMWGRNAGSSEGQQSLLPKENTR